MKIQNIISIIDKQSNKHFKADVGSSPPPFKCVVTSIIPVKCIFLLIFKCSLKLSVSPSEIITREPLIDTRSINSL